MKGNTPHQQKRQRDILQHAQPLIESVLKEAEGYSDKVERGYFLGAVGISVLMGAYDFVKRVGGQPLADGWLAEHFRGLGSILSEDRTQAVKIELSVDSRKVNPPP